MSRVELFISSVSIGPLVGSIVVYLLYLLCVIETGDFEMSYWIVEALDKWEGPRPGVFYCIFEVLVFKFVVDF
jgi:hypothetical protein